MHSVITDFLVFLNYIARFMQRMGAITAYLVPRNVSSWSRIGV